MKVFLLGAGASKSYSESPTGVRMPIARDFFETFDALDISANPWVLQEGLIGYLGQQGLDAFTYLRSGIDIEDLHSTIARDLYTAKASDEALAWVWPWKAYNELVFLFASVLNEIQNGPVSSPHLGLARAIDATDTIVTFNWDTLMDRALEAQTPWTIERGYGITPRRIFDYGWRDPIPADTDVAVGPRLLKLHGSTNWLTAYPTMESGQFELTHRLDPATVHVFRHAAGPYACFAGRYMPGYVPFSYGYYPPNLDAPGREAPPGHVLIRARTKGLRPEGTSSDDGLVSMPLIIPPVREKTYELYGGLFGELWNAAEDGLAQADEIIVIGYSFPRTDVRSRALFTNAFMRRRTMPKVTIIDPAPERIAELFVIEFGIQPSHLRVIKDYFTDRFDIGAALQARSW